MYIILVIKSKLNKIFKMRISKYTQRAVIGGLISLVIILAGTFLMGKLSGYEAKILIRHSLSGMHTLCNTIYSPPA